MLKLILSRDWVAGRDEILRQISRDIACGQGNRILMVPELISHDMERRLCAWAGDTASRFAEVLSFTRLGRRVPETLGIPVEECLDNGGRVVAMAAAARQLHSQLKAYASVETRPEFLTGLIDAVDEFKRCCITAADLKQAAQNTEGAFAQKLEELSLILEAYDSLCSRGKRDPRDQMTWLLGCLQDSDFTRKHVFYIDGFPDFTRQHMAILEYMIQTAPQVVVSMNCDRPGSSDPAFEKAGETVSQLLLYAKRAGIPFEIVTLQAQDSPLNVLRDGLYRGNVEPVPELKDRLFVCRADTVSRECQAAAHRVLHLVHNGCRYRRIGIVCTDMAAYKDVLSQIFSRFNIPLYRSGTENILQKNVITTVLSALDAALGSFETQDVLRYLKSSLSPLSRERCDALENYVIIWSISGKRWLKPWENHPDGLSAEWTPEATEILAQLNNDREACIRPLSQLQRKFRDATRLSQQVQALCDFLEEIGLAQRLSEVADEMDAAGDNRSAQILNQLWEILLSALEQLYDVLGETAWDADVFTRLFTLLLSQYDVGTIPPVLDSVIVGPVSAMRCQEVDHLILLGAREGQLPGYCGSSGVLTDQERTALREMGVPLTGGGMEGLQAEFSEIYGVFCGARQSVMVSYHGPQPSFICRRLAAMAGGEYPVGEMVWGSDPLDAAAWLASQGAKQAAEALGLSDTYRQLQTRCGHTLGAVSQKTVEKLYGRKLRLSASRIDKQAECRLAYFLHYGLSAKERKEATVDQLEFGTYIHAALEHTARDVMEKGGFWKVSLEETLQIAGDHARNYVAEHFGQLDSSRLNYLLKHNNRELEMIIEELWRELSTSRFVPVDFELSFGSDGKLAAIRIPNKAMEAELRGFVDRVDAWSNGHTNYYRVVDYKTGKKDFDYCDVFNGIGLQLLLYLFALKEQGGCILGQNSKPAGVLYFPARSPVISADGREDTEQEEKERAKAWKRKGLLLEDSTVIDAMEPDGVPGRLCCKITKDGSLKGDIATRDQLDLLRGYLFRILGKLVGEIADGNIDPNPYTRGSGRNACSYCPYKPICHYTTVTGRRNYKTMTSQRFWDEIGKEMAHHG